MRQWSLTSLSSDLKEESWSADREMEGLWTGMKTTVGHREGSGCSFKAVRLGSRKLMSSSVEYRLDQQMAAATWWPIEDAQPHSI